MRTKEELEIEFLKTKLDRAVCLRMIKLLYIKISIYSSLLCTMLLASLLEAILSGNTIKMVVFAIALVMGLWVVYNDIRNVGEVKRIEEVVAKQFLCLYAAEYIEWLEKQLERYRTKENEEESR